MFGWEERKTWPEAEAQCQKEGGHLASVTSQEENNEVLKVASAGRTQAVWLGGKGRVPIIKMEI